MSQARIEGRRRHRPRRPEGAPRPSSSEAHREPQNAARSPTGAIRIEAAAERRKGKVVRSGSSSSRAEHARLELNRGEDQERGHRATPRRPAAFSFPLRSTHAFQLLPAAVSLPVNLMLAISAYGSVNGPSPLLVEVLDEGLGAPAVPVEEVADELRPVPP